MFDFMFFFKQKTAYEMRISDWSSDVCSSDLRVGLDRLALYLGRRRQGCDAGAGRTAGSGKLQEPRWRNAQHPLRGAEQESVQGMQQPRRRNRPDREIGRASCRERVCQYV